MKRSRAKPFRKKLAISTYLALIKQNIGVAKSEPKLSFNLNNIT